MIELNVKVVFFNLILCNFFFKNKIKIKIKSENVDFFFVDTTPFERKYWTHPKDHHYDWRNVEPRDQYIENLLKV